MPAITLHEFRACKVVQWNEDYIETVFRDGEICPAVLSNDPESRARARSLGYKDTRTMHLEHEIAHTYLSEAMGRGWSPALRARSLQKTEDHWREEALVLAFQRYLNDGTFSPELSRVEYKSLADDFKRRFRGKEKSSGAVPS